VQRLSEARQKSSEARASREADFLARLDAERSQVIAECVEPDSGDDSTELKGLKVSLAV